jgi:hypothetical protein
MGRRPNEGNAKALILMLALFIGMAGCSSSPERPTLESSTTPDASWVPATPCGELVIRSPLVPVKGQLTTPPSDHAVIRLWVAPDTSLTAVLRVLEQCPALREAAVNSAGVFDLGVLPPGQYTAALDARVFGTKQGFPIVKEMSTNTSHVVMLWCGGSMAWSVAVFRVNEGPLIMNASQ